VQVELENRGEAEKLIEKYILIELREKTDGKMIFHHCHKRSQEKSLFPV